MDSPRRGQCTSCLDVHGFDSDLWQKRCHREECQGNVILSRTPPKNKMYVALECPELQIAICDVTETFVDCSPCRTPHVIFRPMSSGCTMRIKESTKTLRPRHPSPSLFRTPDTKK